LLEFDRKKQIASGVREESVVASLTGTQTAALSQAVNAILDEHGKSGPIWYQDVDYVDFVRWHEDRWRGAAPNPNRL
jgi:hypothetical protein